MVGRSQAAKRIAVMEGVPREQAARDRVLLRRKKSIRCASPVLVQGVVMLQIRGHGNIGRHGGEVVGAARGVA